MTVLASITDSITDSLTSFIGDQGLYAVFLLMLVDAVLPAASELVMVYGGALAAGAFTGQHVVLFGDRITTPFWGFVAISLAGAIGYLIGSIGGWFLGRYGRGPVERHGRWLHLSPERLDRAELWFDKYGGWAVFLGRVTPVVRSFISVPAGLFRQPLGRYTTLTAIGSAIWCFALAGVGWGIGRSWEQFHHDFRYVDYAVLAAIVAVAAWLMLRWRSRKVARADDPPR